MKEMVGGCCVCSDDRGWTENPLVYCDGQGCTVAVHQACYGIVTVPSGPWFCRKCESQERAARVRCELCPSKDGALKRTDTTGWAHVVCALYIPEVRFGNVTTMEPIILSMVPPDRFNKGCYICESQGRESKSKIGACMNCNKPGCKHHFHVTCAQAMGLLCEEAGNYLDNVKYCGYCQHHYSKLKKGANLKTIPAFKPLPPVGVSTESTPEKLNPSQVSGSNWSGQLPPGASNCNGSKEKTRKKPGRKSSSQVSPKAGNSRDSTSSSVIVEAPNTADDSKMKSAKNETTPFANVLAGVGLVPGPRVTTMNDQSNNSGESNDMVKQDNIRTEPIKSSGMKKTEKFNDNLKSSAAAPIEVPNMINALVEKNRSVSRRKSSTRSVTPVSQGGNDTESTTSNVSDPGLTTPVAESAFMKSEQCINKGPVVKLENLPIESNQQPVVHSVIVSSASVLHPESTFVSQRAVSPLIISTSASGSSQIQTEAKLNYSHMIYQQNTGGKERPPVPAKKPRRGRTPKVSAPVAAPDSPPSSPDSAAGAEQQPPKRRKRATKNVETPASTLNSEIQQNLTVSINRAEGYLSAQLTQHSSTESMLRRDYPPVKENKVEPPPPPPVVVVLPTNELPPIGTSPSTSVKDLNSHKDSPVSKENNVYIKNGIIAPHMLGNQLNPNSSVAQKMTDTLTAELEAHSVTHPVDSANFTGVPFPVRVVSPSLKTNVPPSGGTSTTFPNNLEQLLMRQWEQGSQFLMEQAQRYDIATLLSVLHNLRQENMRLEDHVMSLNRRRDHLLAVQARLSVPLSASQSSQFPNTHLPDRSTPGTGHPAGLQRASPQERNSRGTPYLPQMENGIGMSEHLSTYMGTTFSSPHGSHRSSASSSHDRVIPSPVIVSSRMNPVYSVPSTMSPVQSSSSFMMTEGRNLTVLRSPSSTPDATRSTTTTPSQQQQQQQPPYAYQIVSPPPTGSYSAMGNNQQHNMRDARRDPLGRPSSIERR